MTLIINFLGSLLLVIIFVGIVGGFTDFIITMAHALFRFRLRFFTKEIVVEKKDVESFFKLPNSKFWRKMAKKYGFEDREDYSEINIKTGILKVIKNSKRFPII